MRKLLFLLLALCTFLPSFATVGKTHKYTTTINTDNDERLEMFFVKGRNSKGPNGLVILVCGVPDTHNYRTFVEFRTKSGNRLLAKPLTPKGGNNIDRHKNIVFFECYFKEEDLDLIQSDFIETVVVSGIHYNPTNLGNRRMHTLIERMMERN